MAKSRYSDTEIIDERRYGTWSLPLRSGGLREPDLLDNVKTVQYTIKVGDRPDHLAARFWNEDRYWWVICLVNNISYPFASGGWIPGKKIKVPVNISDVLEKILE